MRPRLADPHPYVLPRRSLRRRIARAYRITASTVDTTYRTTRWIVRKNRAHRRKLAPVHAALALLALGASLHQAPDGARTAAALTLAGALGLWAWQRRRAQRRRPLTGRKLAYAWAALLSGMAWAVAAALHGLSAPMPGILLAWTLSFGGLWWWHHRIRPHHEPELADIDPRVLEWMEYADQVLAGATMGNPVDIPDPDDQTKVIGWQADVEVPKGKRFSALIDKVEDVAGIYDCTSATDVTIEPTRGESVRRGVVRVYREHPLYRVQSWPGPHLLDVETGVAPIAAYADRELALYRFYRRGSGPVHDLISGTTDAGKSRLLDQLLAYERACPFMASVVIDPQQGQSLPKWRKQVALFARSVDEGIAALRAVEAEMFRRNRVLSEVQWVDEKGREQEGIEHFDPLSGPAALLGMKLICLTIDEAHMILEIPEAVKIVERIAKMARKCGIKLRLVTQVPLLDQLGGSTTLRDMLVAGNCIVLRTANRLSTGLVFGGKLPVDPFLIPSELPDGSTSSGLCFISGPKSRPAMARVLLVEDTYHWAHEGETTELPDLVELYERAKADTESDDGPLTTSSAAATVAGNPALMVTAAEAKTCGAKILAYLKQRGKPATTSILTHDLDIKIQTVSTTCGRLVKRGQLVQRTTGLWELPEWVNAAASDEAATENCEADDLAGVA